MAISKELEPRGPKKPILLNGTGQSLCLKVKIGNLGIELWNFPNEEAQPYARLFFAQERDGMPDNQTEEERRRWTVILNWQECFAVSGAVQEWLSFLESDIEEYREPALHIELRPLTFDFYRHGKGQGTGMVCTLDIESGLSRQVILTRSEASLLGRLLFCLDDDDAE